MNESARAVLNETARLEIKQLSTPDTDPERLNTTPGAPVDYVSTGIVSWL